MKKISLLACFLLFVSFFSSINGQITIGTGTAYSEKYPFNGFYKYSWSNVIYLSSEINSAGSLTSVAFYVDNSPVNYVMNNQKIYARHTSASTITGTNYPTTDGFTLVYDGTVTYNGTGWKTINLTTPFLYNGTSNIEFLFENKAGTYTTGFPYFRYTSTPSGTVNYRLKRDYYDTYFPTDCPAYCGSINNIPNIKLTIQPCTFNVGNIVASSSLVVPGNQTTLSITGQDPTASIQWQSSIDNINFKSISGATSTSFTDNINVTTYYRALLTTNSCTKISSTSTVTADLSSMIVKSIGNGTSATQNYPFNHLYNYNWSNMIYKASEINSSGKLSRIAVNVANNPVNVTMPNQKIWVRHTTATSYPNATYPTSTGFTLVYDGSISYNGSGWKEIVLNGNFTYNGTDNLEFLFENRSGFYAPYYPTFSFESGTQAEFRVRKDNQDASFPVAGSTSAIYSKNLMNIQLKFIPCSLNAGTISSSSTTFCSGTTTTLTLANQTAGSTIQWQTSSDNVTWTNTGNTASSSNTTLGITNQTATKYYKAIVTLNGCTATSSVQTLSVTPSSVAGTITGGTSAVCAGTNSTILTLTGYTGNIQWQSSLSLTGTYSDIVGATNATYLATNLSATSYYRAKVTSGTCSSATTNAQVVIVNPLSVAGTITGATTVCSGTNSTTLTLSGNTGSIQWQSSDNNGAFISISGATTSTLYVTNLTSTTSYQAIVTSATCASSTTPGVTMTVSPVSVEGTITVTGSNSYCSTTNSTTLNLNGNIGRIQWQSSSSASPTNFTNIAGETSSSLVLTNLTNTNNYRAVVTNASCASATTSIQTITVNPIVAGIISVTPSTILEGQSSSIILTGQTIGSSIQWQQLNSTSANYTSISGQTSSTLLVTNVQETTTYKAIVSNNGCTANSNEVIVTVDASNLITATIGNGTSTTEKYPFNGNYDYSWTSTIYKSSEINTSGSLSRLSFYVNNNPINETMNNQKIYVRHTNANEQTDLNYPTIQGFTLVYDGSITYNGTGWKEIVLQTQFIYNGIDNLEFLFENRDGSSSTNFPTFYYESGQAEYRTKRDYKIGTFPAANSGSAAKYANILNIKMKFVPCTTNAGTISATNTSVAIGSTINLSITGHESSATIQWQKSWDNINFESVVGQSGTSCSLQMIATTMYIRAIVTNGCSKFSNIVSITPNTCFTTIASIGTNTVLSTDKYPFNGFYNNSWVNVIYKSTELGQEGKLASASFNVVNTPVNFVMNKQRIYARHTTKSEYSDSSYTDTVGYKLIFDGTITYNGTGWKEIPFTTPFEYDGTSNLEFLFENRDGSWGTGYPMFGYSNNQDGFRVKRDYRDTDFPVLCENCRRFKNVPNIKLEFMPSPTIGGMISASETEVCNGKTSVLTLTGQTPGSTIQWQSSTNGVDFDDVIGQKELTYIVNSLSSKSYFRIKSSLGSCFQTSSLIELSNVCISTSKYNSITGKGEITVDISSLPNNFGPYSYFISETTIPDLLETYRFLRDSIYTDSIGIDSIQFLRGNFPETNFTFNDLDNREYNIAVFNTNGLRIYDKKVVLNPEYILENNIGMIGSKNNLITSNTPNAKAELNLYFDEESIGDITFTVQNPTNDQYFGFLNSGNSLNDKSSIVYGFSINNGFLNIIEDGIEISTNRKLTVNDKLNFSFNENTIDYNLNDYSLKESLLSNEFILKTVFSADIINTKVEIKANNPIIALESDTQPYPTDPDAPLRPEPAFVKPHSLIFDPTSFVVTPIKCKGETGVISFKIKDYFNNIKNIQYFNFTISDESGNIIYKDYYLNPQNIYICPFKFINPGVYTLNGIAFESNRGSKIAKNTIFVGVETSWNSISNYSLYPNSYSVEKNKTYRQSQALSVNVLQSGAEGVIMFEPKISSIPTYVSFSTNNLNISNFNSVEPSFFYYTLPNSNTTNSLYVFDFNHNLKRKLLLNKSTKIAILITLNNINVYINGNINPIFTPDFNIARPTGDIRYKFNANVLLNSYYQPNNSGGGAKNVVSNFFCDPGLSQLSYFEAKKDFTSGYTLAVQGKVKFTFDEEYKISSNKYLPIKIYDDNFKILVQSDIEGNITDFNPTNSSTIPSTELLASELKYQFDDNRYVLTISKIAGIIRNKYYIIETITSTGDKRYVRFLYKY